ncbi:MAG: ATP-binding protein [Gammaproteobacteria bacterium]|nr:ATP-binding protein [Gammaproteobacteria bacterium]
MYKRSLRATILALLQEFRIVYVTGPRQSGKTTLARSIADDLGMGYITLDDQATFASVESDPHGFIRSVGSKPVVLDEFQYAPTLIPAIKEVSDQLRSNEKGRFLLTGSADIFRSALTQEALPGHMAKLELLPLSITEIDDQPLNLIDYLLSGNFFSVSSAHPTREDIAHLILCGGYPEVQGKSPKARQIWYRSYMEGRLYKDFASLYAARGDYHSRIKALASYLAGLSGNLLKYSNIANVLELDDRLSKSYIEILELMFIIRRAPAYIKNRAKRLVTRMPKLHYVDTGLACHLLGLRTEEQIINSQFHGGLLESLIYMEICKHAAWSREEVEIYHFRDKRKREVDIVLEHSNSKIIGVEVKASASVHAGDFTGLVNLAEFSGNAFERGILFYNGREILPFRVDTVECYAIPIGVMLGTRD